MTILLVEPNRLLAQIYLEVLRRSGHMVRWQTNAQDAIFDADAYTPGLIILELQLAGHSGVEFLYELRSYAEWQRIPVILHSFLPDSWSAKERQMLGIADYFYKPTTSLQELEQAVNRLPVSLP